MTPETPRDERATEAVERVQPRIEVQDLLWLLDAPLFIDEKQVSSFYNAVVRPDIVENPATQNTTQYKPKSIKFEITSEKEVKTTDTIGGKATATLGLGGVLKSLFPSLEIEGSAERENSTGEKKGDGQTVELEPVENPQRQLVHLAVHYAVNVFDRLFLVNNPLDENWRDPKNILKSPRALAFLDLPKVKIIPTAAEFENSKIELLYTKLEAKSGERPPDYPESPKILEADLPAKRKEYWQWFDKNFSGSKAIQVVEAAASTNGRIRWIDYRMPLNDEGDTLHLHLCPNGKFDTGVLAYNFIKRGEKHGLRLVGTLKSEPGMNVLAVYEK